MRPVFLVENSPNNLDDVIGTFLYNRNLTKDYLDISQKDEIPFDTMRNMNEAVDVMINALAKNKKIYVLVDCDVDGYTSAAALIGYIERIPASRSYTAEYLLHTGKQHGLTDPNIIIPEDCGLLIIPDAGSADSDQCNTLISRGCDVIILDHHDLNGSETNNAIVVSSQYPDYANPQLSGVGVVYKFLQAMDDALWENNADIFLDLVALGNVADVMSMKSRETKYLVQKGLGNVVNPMFKAILDKQSFNIQETVPSIREIQFSVAPQLNALIRMGAQEDKRLLFEAMLGHDHPELEFSYKKRGSNEIVQENIYEYVARICQNVKASQDRAKKGSITKMKAVIKNKNMDENKLLLCDVTGMLDETLTGVTAQAMSKEYNRPCLLLRNVKNASDTYGGSARNSREDYIPDLKAALEETGLFEALGGHANSFGFRIKKENIPALVEKTNTMFNEMSYQKTYHVDFEADLFDIPLSFFDGVHSIRRLIGKDIDEPTIYVKNIYAPLHHAALIGKDLNTLRIQLNGNEGFRYTIPVELVKFNCGDNDPIKNDLKDSWITEDGWTISAVCTAGMNFYKGRLTPQLIINEYWIEEQ